MTHPNYLGAHRKSWALTKKELAQLIGYRSHDPVSRCEHLLRDPNLRLALGCEVVFGRPARTLFPALYLGIEEEIMARAAALDARLRVRRDAVAERKRELLRQMVERAHTLPLV